MNALVLSMLAPKSNIEVETRFNKTASTVSFTVFYLACQGSGICCGTLR
jgi:hypothetical protein